jgi:hypothetical protein
MVTWAVLIIAIAHATTHTPYAQPVSEVIECIAAKDWSRPFNAHAVPRKCAHPKLVVVIAPLACMARTLLGSPTPLVNTCSKQSGSGGRREQQQQRHHHQQQEEQQPQE